jgi:NAD(P)-dependent dehydrogenase (short-subunit alcohol dehydrogenase family)
MSFADRVVLITGAGRGIGRTLAERFARQAAKVVVNDVNPDTSAATVEGIAQAGGQAWAISADVANKMAVQTMHYQILERWQRVDILINNAGVDPGGSLLSLDEWAWDRTLNVNLKGAFLCTQTVGRSMKEQGGGAIVNIARGSGLHPPGPAYAAGLGGLLALTRECARELAACSIRVNAIVRGRGLLEKQADERPPPVQGQDAAGLILYLCSQEAHHLTGHAFDVES